MISPSKPPTITRNSTPMSITATTDPYDHTTRTRRLTQASARPAVARRQIRDGHERRAGHAAREVVQARSTASPAVGLGVEDVGADRQPGEDAAGAASAAQTSIADVEAVGHLRRVVEAVAGEAGDHRQHGDREQAGDPGDGVVDARGDAGVACVGGGEHGRRDRRHDQGQAERRRRSPPAGRSSRSCRRGRSGSSAAGPTAITSGPDRQRDPGPDPLGQRAGAGREAAASAAVTGSEAAPASIGE